MREALYLRILDRVVRVECSSRSVLTTVEALFGHWRSEPYSTELDYSLVFGRDGSSRLVRDGEELVADASDGELLWELDGDLAVELQKFRSELYFLHAAVVAYEGAAYALVAESGGGKSWLCWALLCRGCEYSSDELSPVDLESVKVHPFPRALSLKAEPGPDLELPERVVRTSRALYVPTGELPARVVSDPLPLAGVFFLTRDPSASEPRVAPISAAAGATRLYVNSLNPLAHPADGLDAAIRIARSCECYELTSADLVATAELVLETIGARNG